jgi:hypothetical protein
MKISIKETFKDDYISRVAGEKLRHAIEEAYQNNESIELDFSNVTIASTSFFDEGIAKLALEGWDRAQFNDRVTLRGMNARDQKVMEKMCEFRGLV